MKNNTVKENELLKAENEVLVETGFACQINNASIGANNYSSLQNNAIVGAGFACPTTVETDNYLSLQKGEQTSPLQRKNNVRAYAIRPYKTQLSDRRGVLHTPTVTLVSASPQKSQETLKRVQGDGFKKGNGFKIISNFNIFKHLFIFRSTTMTVLRGLASLSLLVLLSTLNTNTCFAKDAEFNTIIEALNYSCDRAAVTIIVITGEIHGDDYSSSTSDCSKFLTLDGTFTNHPDWNEPYYWNSIDKKVNVEEMPQKLEVRIFPNPTNGSATVSFELANAGNLHILLSDLSGRELLLILFDDFVDAGLFTKNINTEHLRPGVYFLSIYIEGKLTVEKLIVE